MAPTPGQVLRWKGRVNPEDVPCEWVDPAGAQGQTGPQGASGQTGATGSQGPTGPTGATGPQGGAGATGPQGLAGDAGTPSTPGQAGATGPQGATGPGGTDDSGGRIFCSALSSSNTGSALASGTAYWTYLGKTAEAMTFKFVEFWVSVVGAGAQTAEVALASTPQGPNKANQSLTRIAATGTVDALTSTGLKRNTSSLDATVPAGTHLWAGIRTAMATTQPTVFGRWGDFNQGWLLRTATAGALTGSGPWTGSKVTAAAAWQGPDLRATLD